MAYVKNQFLAVAINYNIEVALVFQEFNIEVLT
jgi:hypothetical protein